MIRLKQEEGNPYPASSTSCLPLSLRTTLIVLMPLCLHSAMTCSHIGHFGKWILLFLTRFEFSVP